MPRPETIADVKDRAISLGILDLASILSKPKVIAAYGSFVLALEEANGPPRRTSTATPRSS